MRALAVRTIGKAVAERALLLGPGRTRAMAAALVAGGAAAAVTYRTLRGSGAGRR